MYGWALIPIILVSAGGCLLAMGVGANALVELLAALLLMSGIAYLIARPFLSDKTRR